MVGPKRPDANVCWCLSYRLRAKAQTSYATSRRSPHVDDLPAWSVWCIRVRPGHPVDNRGERVDLTMAYPGLRSVFERAGFSHAPTRRRD